MSLTKQCNRLYGVVRVGCKKDGDCLTTFNILCWNGGYLINKYTSVYI